MSPTRSKTTRVDCTRGPLLGNILRFALPLALASVLQLLFTAVDQVVVGRFAGPAALAAVGSNQALINLLVNFFVGFSVGTNVTCSRFFGAKDFEGVRRTVHTAMVLSVLFGFALTLIGVAAARPMLVWMGSPDDVLDLAALYLRIYFGGISATMVYNFGAALLRASGDTRRPLYCLTLSGVINLFLNLVFVIVFHMGVAGVGLATVISQFVAAALVVRILAREDGPLRLEAALLRLWPGPLRSILHVGLPTGLQSVVFSFANVTVQATTNSFGSAVVAGSAAAASLEGFVLTSMDAFGQTCVTFNSQNLGAGNIRRVYRSTLLCHACAVTAGLVLGLSFAANSEFLLGLYARDPEVIAAGTQRMMAICAPYALCGFMNVGAGAMRGLGYSVLPTVVSLCGSCLFRLVWIALVFPLNPTVLMLYMTYPVSWVLTGGAHLLCFLAVRKTVEARFAVEQ